MDGSIRNIKFAPKTEQVRAATDNIDTFRKRIFN